MTMVVAAALSVAAGWLQPPAWVLAALLGAILVGVWLVAIGRSMSAHAWSELDDGGNVGSRLDQEIEGSNPSSPVDLVSTR